MASYLISIGFETFDAALDGTQLRYQRGPLIVDLLAPDHLPRTTDLTTIPPGRSIETAGGSQALERIRYMPIRHKRRTAHVPLPSIVGAIGIKAAAVEHGYGHGKSDKHLLDLAFLLCLLRTADEFLATATPADVSVIARCSRLADLDSHIWTRQNLEHRTNGQEAFLSILAVGRRQA